MKNLLFLLCFLPFSALGQNMASETEVTEAAKKLAELFDKIEAYEEKEFPESVLYRGQHLSGKFSDDTPEAYEKRKANYQGYVDILKALDENQLDQQERISRQTMILRLENNIADTEFEQYLIPFNAEGGFYNSMNYVLGRLPFKTKADYEAYLAWLPNYVVRLEQNLSLMKRGLEKGIIAPKVIVENTLELLKPWLVKKTENSPFYRPFLQFPEGISSEDQAALSKQASELLENSILPFYQKLEAFLRKEYLKKAPQKPGVSFLPKGKAYYENRVKYYTTLDISPDSVHQLGLQEVARIRKQMEEIISEVEFKGSFAEFLTFLRTDPQFYAKTPQELLNHAAWLSKKAEASLPKLFKKLYSLPFTVAPVPAEIAPNYTAGRFVPGSWEAQQPGTYWVNTYDLPSRPLYTLPALTLHEAVPGHHLQGSLAAEITGLPRFRTSYYISAFGEGWGLYSEFLGEEMGMYTTPYERFGRYTYEMWRACRLVVDTGIHYKGWSREEAVEYMQSNTALSIHEVNTEINRYIGWPGQAVSYKIGEIKIKALRQKAEKALAETFDVREFHYHILKNGSVPLSVLEEVIGGWVTESKGK